MSVSTDVLPNQIILDAVYDTRTAGKLMGGLHPNQVNALIKEKKLEARYRSVRGSKKGRTVIMGREIKRFNESLPVRGTAGEVLPPTSAIHDEQMFDMSKIKRPRRMKLSGVKQW